jgi:hypothetical protein
MRRHRSVFTDTVVAMFRNAPPIDADRFRADLDVIAEHPTVELGGIEPPCTNLPPPWSELYTPGLNFVPREDLSGGGCVDYYSPREGSAVSVAQRFHPVVSGLDLGALALDHCAQLG